jgi:hypothetical protein
VVEGEAIMLKARSYYGFLPYRKYAWSIAPVTVGDTGDWGVLIYQQEHGARNEISTVTYTAPRRGGHRFKITVSVTDDAGNTDADFMVIGIDDRRKSGLAGREPLCIGSPK